MRKAELLVAGFEDARKHKREMWTASKSSVPLPGDSPQRKRVSYNYNCMELNFANTINLEADLSLESPERNAMESTS